MQTAITSIPNNRIDEIFYDFTLKMDDLRHTKFEIDVLVPKDYTLFELKMLFKNAIPRPVAPFPYFRMHIDVSTNAFIHNIDFDTYLDTLWKEFDMRRNIAFSMKEKEEFVKFTQHVLPDSPMTKYFSMLYEKMDEMDRKLKKIAINSRLLQFFVWNDVAPQNMRLIDIHHKLKAHEGPLPFKKRKKDLDDLF